MDRLSAGGRDLIYHLTAEGARALADLGVDATRTPLAAGTGIRHCVDWSEQRHHLAGRVGAALADRLFELGWLERGPVRRTVVLTATGRAGLDAHFGITGLS
ncbi:MAG: hypothetical protein M3066_19660 [Actinomycetota bacterium]|nr:hypothetical protein [Actinomycetota bacterium]